MNELNAADPKTSDMTELKMMNALNTIDPKTRGMTALHKVVSPMNEISASQEEMLESYVNCLHVLLSCQYIDINAQNYDNETALHLASENG